MSNAYGELEDWVHVAEYWRSLYAQGFFPMADGAEGQVQWYAARAPAVLPLDEGFHIPRSLAKHMRKTAYETRWNTAFEQVLEACADRPDVWISAELKGMYRVMRAVGMVHSFEAWLDGRLVGGVLGLQLGAAFVGESMFTAVPNGGKSALVLLVQELRTRQFRHFDCQLLNDHTQRFGAFEMDPASHKQALAAAIAAQPLVRNSMC
jgi:leucyl/phenylalanyl-tRNA---protein transferase